MSKQHPFSLCNRSFPFAEVISIYLIKTFAINSKEECGLTRSHKIIPYGIKDLSQTYALTGF